MLPVLGFDFLRPAATREHLLDATTAPTLTMSDVGTSATAKEVDGAFVVLRGSTARRHGSASWDSYIALRDELVAQKKLVPKTEELFEFAEDVEFSSPSAAAAVVAGANRNGRVTWKLPSGVTYAQWKEMEVEQAEE